MSEEDKNRRCVNSSCKSQAQAKVFLGSGIQKHPSLGEMCSFTSHCSKISPSSLFLPVRTAISPDTPNSNIKPACACVDVSAKKINIVVLLRFRRDKNRLFPCIYERMLSESGVTVHPRC